MKKVIMLTAVLGVVFMSCNNKAKVNNNIPVAPAVPVIEALGDHCYSSIEKNDTITMRININANNEVNGDLTYIPYQKDRNEGTIIGNIKGDTLIADYTFMSEGQTSVREVAFLMKDSKYIEGYGAALISNGKRVFTDKNQLNFNGKTLSEVECSTK